MSYTSKVIYTRPSAEVSLFTPSAEFTTLIDTYFNAGKITQKPVLVEDSSSDEESDTETVPEQKVSNETLELRKQMNELDTLTLIHL